MSEASGPGQPRPRPQFGEYATPEEQRARIQRPEVTEALDAGVAPRPEQPAPAAVASDGARPGVLRGPLWDRILTGGLLAYGLVSTVSTIVQLLDFPHYAESAATVLGADAAYTNLQAGYVWGAAAALVYGIGWLLTAVLSWRRLKRGRVAFWIPIAGFVVTALIAGICVTLALVGDQQFMTAIIGAVPD
ncbi:MULTISPECIES: DUF6264 family protein [Microbacterium]|uniref:DUF6264 family protein n=1 Tax=Microbacterium TaxID=33882 RepID=UPI0027816A80|nr:MULTISPECIES: DUF6264 family protein [Microbacterium]MDQ1083752.1 hypothetical protein [Microbacterium sp. SORGH_AS_0344]MDQ1170970.1 hypothetical protein [Microbacterium proteolyticum]